MSSLADKMQRDGNLSFEGGQDAGRSPSVIARNQVACANNTSMRGGFIKPRPPFVKRTYEASSAGVESGFKDGRFQHAGFFDGSGSPMLLSSHGGRFFKIDLVRKTLTEITPLTYRDTETTADFVGPNVDGTVVISVTNSYRMTPTIASGLSVGDVPLTINGVPWTLVAVNSTTSITVKNTLIANVAVNVVAGATVRYAYSDTNSERLRQGWSFCR